MPSALKDAVHGILAILYSDFISHDTKARNELIRQRYAVGEGLSELAREFGISPQWVYQIVHFKRK